MPPATAAITDVGSLYIFSGPDGADPHDPAGLATGPAKVPAGSCGGQAGLLNAIRPLRRTSRAARRQRCRETLRNGNLRSIRQRRPARNCLFPVTNRDSGMRVAGYFVRTSMGHNRSDVLRSGRSGSKPETANKNKKTDK
jgi:hypothetical protein